MNKHAFPIIALASCWLLQAGELSLAREPVRSVEDLARLQTQVQNVADKAGPATVALLSARSGSSGSGVVTSPDGLILTAAHVIQGNKEVLVVFPNGRQVRGEVLGANYSKDIAMVRIKEPGPWPYAPRGRSKPLVAGDWVVALGHSAGFEADRPPPVRFGRVVSKGPGNFLTTSCTLIGGDSGGPLFDLEGRIVGIHSSIGVAAHNNNHAGVDGFAEDWDRLLEGHGWGRLSLNPFANPEMPVLGIEMGLRPAEHGVPVADVVPRSPAAAAGVRRGDIITAISDSQIGSGNELLQILAKHEAGDTVKVALLRNGEPVEVKVRLEARNRLFREP